MKRVCKCWRAFPCVLRTHIKQPSSDTARSISRLRFKVIPLIGFQEDQNNILSAHICMCSLTSLPSGPVDWHPVPSYAATRQLWRKPPLIPQETNNFALTSHSLGHRPWRFRSLLTLLPSSFFTPSPWQFLMLLSPLTPLHNPSMSISVHAIPFNPSRLSQSLPLPLSFNPPIMSLSSSQAITASQIIVFLSLSVPL